MMKCPLGIALLAALVAPAAHANADPLHFKAGHQQVCVGGDTANTVGGPASLPDTDCGTMVLYARYGVAPAFTAPGMSDGTV